ncbi:MAG: FoF1 ATP synthase subunit gamma [Pseudomonadota bacterium]
MPTSREIQTRLGSARGLREIVHSMRSLAAISLRRAEEGLATAREYRALAGGLLSTVAPPLGPVARRGAGRGVAAVVVFTSDQGLCGQFNERTVDFALSEAGRLQAECRFIVVGERGAAIFEERGVAVLSREGSPRGPAGIGPAVRGLALDLAELHGARQIDTLQLVYSRHESAGRYYPVRLPVLPPLLEPPQPRRRGRPPFLYTSPEATAAVLLEEYVFSEIHGALSESLASENGARLRAMDEALHGMDETIEALGQQYRTMRQEEITAEILDVVGGAEALKSKPR